MSTKKDTRVVLTMEVKKFILDERERKMTIAEIEDAVFQKFGIRTSKSAIPQVFAKKNEILSTMENDKSDWKQRKRYLL